MKLGDLVDAIRELERAEQEIEAAETSLLYGGNETTMKSKQWVLDMAIAKLANLREQDISELGE